MKLNHLSASVAVALLTHSVIAAAQEESPKESKPTDFEQIIVTANFKEQSLQETGMAIDAISADRLAKENITSAAELAALVPALTITNSGGISSQVYMRGVGNKSNNNYLDPAIILTYDGVALAKGSATAIGGFFDLARVEVLKGPQGTLYGKNATGGVLNLVPVKPKLEETSGFVSGLLGNYGASNISGAINLPVTKNSAIRIAANKISRDGINKDGTNDDDRTTVRLQYLHEFSDEWSLRIAGDMTDIGGVGFNTQPMGAYDPDFNYIPSGLDVTEGPASDASNAYRNTVLSAPGFGFLNAIDGDELYTDATLKGLNAELIYRGEDFTMTFIPAWRKSEQDSRFVGPGFNYGWWQNTAEQRSAELRFAGMIGDDIDYIAGVYYFDEDLIGNNTFNQEFVLPLQDYTSSGTSKAVFGELTFHINEEMRLIGGARFTKDDKELTGEMNNFITFCGGLPPALITPPASFAQGCHIEGNLPHYPTLDTPEQATQWLIDNGWASNVIPIPPGYLIPLDNGIGQVLHAINQTDTSYSDSEPTFKISYEWDVSADSMLYLTYSTGYRSGGLQPATNDPYEAEYIKAYTLGANNTLLDGSLQLNVETFYWDYTDQQISYFNVNAQNVLENTTTNVGASTNKGIDIDALWRATENTTITAKVQYLKATYDDLKFTTSPPRHNINCPMEVVGALDDGTPVMEFECSGSQSIYSPEWSYQLGIEHVVPFNTMNLILALDTRWQNDQVSGFNNLAHENIAAYSTTNLNVTLEDSEGNWNVGIFAHNLEDKHRLTSTQSPLLGVAMGQYGLDMTYGIRATVNF
ncbi:TonB-dependent receptor [Methylophaga thalassica]|uniref:TonB-dependent receptor n=1 Tax=Methylophaga aminisulfidivorans TaxID=230105 RepID=UPI0023532AC8|nr:TonB-dependent receptor [Methylophaga aminisulfidivorans]